MKKTAIKLVLLCFFVMTAYHFIPNTSAVALFWIIKNNVEKKHESNWTAARKGEIIYSGDLVKTDEKSFALVKFNDASTLRVGPKTEVEVFGEKIPGSAHVNSGVVSFDIKKRERERFEFTTPTSVASIRGTEGVLNVGMDGSDFLTILKGLVVLTNSMSKKSVEVRDGETGESKRDGSILVRPSTPDDLKKFESLRDQLEIKEHRLEFQYLDREGKLHKLIIEYED